MVDQQDVMLEMKKLMDKMIESGASFATCVVTMPGGDQVVFSSKSKSSAVINPLL